MLQTAQAPQGRSRSNSLQQMLDLEKKLNFQRAHQGSVPPSPACTDSSGSVPASPGHPRRFELVPKDKKAPTPVRNYSAVPPPLFSANSVPGRSESPNTIPRKPVGKDLSQPSSTEQLKDSADKPGLKTVAFMFPPDVEEQRSVCQSPTWEAYERQKKEKKEEKRKELQRKEEEKRKAKEKEQELAMNQALEEAWKNAPKPRGRKLSKHPPPSPHLGTQGRSTTEPPQAQKRRSRSSSLLGFSIGRNNDDPEEPRRSRSSSLTSIFRKSFEIKRASFDETSATGFLGGKKLEKKKEDFHQKVLEDQARGDSRVHPAMRKSFLGHGSFTPFKISPQQKEEDAKRRAYPPISINTSGARSQSVKPPKSPNRRGSVNIYLWSARARRGSASDDCAVADTDDEGDQNTALTPDSEILYNKAQGLNRRGGLYIKKDQNDETGEGSLKDGERNGPTPRSSNQSMKQAAKAKDSEKAPQQDTITVSRPPITSTTQPQPRRSSAASGLSIPPPPPRRSSKRGSLTLLTRLNNSQPASDEIKSAPVESTKPKDKLFRHNPPSIRYEQTSPGVRPKPITADSEPVTTKWKLKDAAKSAFSRGHSAQNSVSSTMSKESTSSKASTASSVGPPVPPKTDLPISKSLAGANDAPIRTQHVHAPVKHLAPGVTRSPTGRRPTTSSSDSSYSDAIQSVSPMSTPYTSPPQSEMGHSPNIASIKPVTGGPVSPYWSYANSPQMAPIDRFDSNPDPEIDPIQEAANRVMEAFSNANLRNSMARHTPVSSDETSFASTPTHAYPPLKHKPRSKGRLRPSKSGHRSTLSDPEVAIKTLRRQSNLDHQNHGDPTAKMFVECCACTRYHDMPSRLYEAMSNPDGVLSAGETDFAGSVTMTVKCPWCKHEMSTKCCAGFAAMVYIKERFH
ncbi:hypothetical protein FBEOM_4286 [Fusarium beomiforme]|uniref:Uncharacterized protein n=1 Tax=Fusarium beomiforme TaxID=44412 RepID=A0A9P5AN11_9HYPO|nr:hypothetical protein FBEOM_4286 [Fusarium beomiforme]